MALIEAPNPNDGEAFEHMKHTSISSLLKHPCVAKLCFVVTVMLPGPPRVVQAPVVPVVQVVHVGLGTPRNHISLGVHFPSAAAVPSAAAPGATVVLPHVVLQTLW
jgi:hypothetical protein